MALRFVTRRYSSALFVHFIPFFAFVIVQHELVPYIDWRFENLLYCEYHIVRDSFSRFEKCLTSSENLASGKLVVELGAKTRVLILETQSANAPVRNKLACLDFRKTLCFSQAHSEYEIRTSTIDLDVGPFERDKRFKLQTSWAYAICAVFRFFPSFLPVFRAAYVWKILIYVTISHSSDSRAILEILPTVRKHTCNRMTAITSHRSMSRNRKSVISDAREQ